MPWAPEVRAGELGGPGGRAGAGGALDHDVCGGSLDQSTSKNSGVTLRGAESPTGLAQTSPKRVKVTSRRHSKRPEQAEPRECDVRSPGWGSGGLDRREALAGGLSTQAEGTAAPVMSEILHTKKLLN